MHRRCWTQHHIQCCWHAAGICWTNSLHMSSSLSQQHCGKTSCEWHLHSVQKQRHRPSQSMVHSRFLESSGIHSWERQHPISALMSSQRLGTEAGSPSASVPGEAAIAAPSPAFTSASDALPCASCLGTGGGSQGVSGVQRPS